MVFSKFDFYLWASAVCLSFSIYYSLNVFIIDRQAFFVYIIKFFFIWLIPLYALTFLIRHYSFSFIKSSVFFFVYYKFFMINASSAVFASENYFEDKISSHINHLLRSSSQKICPLVIHSLFNDSPSKHCILQEWN